MADEVIGVVGAGIVGLAVARELTLRRPGARIVVFEKEDRVAAHQTSHNSGVVHAGIYYVPGSLKARLCMRGVALLKEYCAAKELPYVECGKLVIAVRENEVPRMDALYGRAVANGVLGLRRVGPEELREIEPHATGLGAIHSPGSAITDYAAVARSFAAEVVAAGGEVRLGYPVDRIEPEGSRVRVGSGEQQIVVDQLVLCAGLQADRVAKLAGDEPGPRIVPFRGEYLRVKNDKAAQLRGLVYPIPEPGYPFLGVHFTRRTDGTVEIGPNAVIALAAEGYRWRDLSPAHLARLAAWPGAWRMAKQHWRMGAHEVYGSISKRAYMKASQQYFPSIGVADVERDTSGVRAQALDRDGALVDDFRIHRLGPVTAVRNAPSPAATSSMAIAEHVVEQIILDPIS
ncbi:MULTISPECIES: L-2-hydroxyglutarate oxidase [Glycomyces]|uniref:L-2-hydroxyglutarate oxidase n=1 Tax=Glycomyces lechevalierae TaxID=256034 RepID=A0A9X3PE99_9ACTN|nr:L-2-hydroxyglutarate oxidase [Glycomyces lechevalierae]MDA1383886.1 L-2-hydroxyglutarate oxidase [Glycomyces lechevalierae]MDR7341122.1 L-2-hydroxyglutarate oxidase LhgO [Glycomyces lechevalierae]